MWDLGPADFQEFFYTRLPDSVWKDVYLNRKLYESSPGESLPLIAAWDEEIFDG